eukprot:TRINITY_DN18931_c0_g1_i2.p1 TRINITY_DN18931_c0_g1~~TRINITY_DN18931_c0_g1_i2.p1  ORF type:complete len:475 (-),score=120.39 TRINITY_DN18931_c0_g1_i2:32-1456(-)
MVLGSASAEPGLDATPPSPSPQQPEEPQPEQHRVPDWPAFLVEQGSLGDVPTTPQAVVTGYPGMIQAYKRAFSKEALPRKHQEMQRSMAAFLDGLLQCPAPLGEGGDPLTALLEIVVTDGATQAGADGEAPSPKRIKLETEGLQAESQSTPGLSPADSSLEPLDLPADSLLLLLAALQAHDTWKHLTARLMLLVLEGGHQMDSLCTMLQLQAVEEGATPSAVLAEQLSACTQVGFDLSLKTTRQLCERAPALTVGSSQIVMQVTSTIDPPKLHDWTSQLLFGKFELIGAEHAATLAAQSLGWESYEQGVFWQLLNAELQLRCTSQLVEHISRQVLSGITPGHCCIEAVAGLIPLLCMVQPSAELLSCVLAALSPVDTPYLAARVLTEWARASADVLEEAVIKFCHSTVQVADDEQSGFVLENMISWLECTLTCAQMSGSVVAVSYTHLRAHETVLDLVWRLLLEKKKKEVNNKK